jgi:hypothetical protein
MHRLFALVMIELWRREHRISFARSADDRPVEMSPVLGIS